MNEAFNNFLSSVGEGLAGAGGPNMKNYTHATKLYVEGSYARAPKFNHLYFVAFNFNDGVIRDPSWIQSGVREVGLLVKSFSLPRFKIKTEEMNQYNRKTQVQTKINYEPVTLEFHDDNSEITNGLWKNYYRYYYTDSIYGGKDDTAQATPSKVSLGEKLFGGLFRPGSKRTAKQPLTKFPEAFTNNKYGATTYPYGLDNNQDKPFFKSIDVFILHQQKFTQMTLINPKITSWDHDEVSQGDSTKVMKNKMTVVYETVLYNDGRVAKGSDSGVFAEAFYDTESSPLSISGKGAASLLGSGGIIAGVEDIFGAGGSIEQGNYLEAILQAATLSKNYDKISPEQIETEGYSMLATGLSIATTSKRGEAWNNISDTYANGGFGIYTNQFSKSNLEEIPAEIVQIQMTEYPGLINTEVGIIGSMDAGINAFTVPVTAEQLGSMDAGVKEFQPVREGLVLSKEEINTELVTLSDTRIVLQTQLSEADQRYAQIAANTPTAVQIADENYIRNSDLYIYAIELGKSPTEAFAAAEQDAKIRRAEGENALTFTKAFRKDIASNIEKIDKISSNLTKLSIDIDTNFPIYTEEYLKNNKEFGGAVYELQGRENVNAIMLEVIKSQKVGEILIFSDHLRNSMIENREQQAIFKEAFSRNNANFNYINNQTVQIWEEAAQNGYVKVAKLDNVYWDYTVRSLDTNTGSPYIPLTKATDEYSRILAIQAVYEMNNEDAILKYEQLIDTGRANYYAQLGAAKDAAQAAQSKIIKLYSDNSTNIENKVDTNIKIGTSTIQIGPIAPNNPVETIVTDTAPTPTVVPDVAPAVTANPTITPTVNTTPTVTETAVIKLVEKAATTTPVDTGELTAEELLIITTDKTTILLDRAELAKQDAAVQAALKATQKQAAEIEKLAIAKRKEMEAALNKKESKKFETLKAQNDALQNALGSVITRIKDLNTQQVEITNQIKKYNELNSEPTSVTKTSAAVTYEPAKDETNVYITQTTNQPTLNPKIAAANEALRKKAAPGDAARTAALNATLDRQAITLFKHFQKTDPSIKTPEDAIRYIQNWNNTPSNFPISVNPNLYQHFLKIKINK